MMKKRVGISFKSVAGNIAILVLFTVIVCFIGYTGMTEALLNQYADGAFRTAEAASLMIYRNRLDSYLKEGGKSDDYKATWKKLDQLCNSTGMTFIYVIQPDTTDYGHITFLFSTINDNSDYTVYDFGYVRETTNNDYRKKYKAIYEEGSKQELVIRDHGYIETDPHITAMVPLIGSDMKVKGILCVQRQMDTLIRVRNSYLGKVLMALLILAVIISFGQNIYVHRTLIRPIQMITSEAIRFAGENVSGETKLTQTIRNQDEVGLLAGAIDRMEERIQEYVQDLTQITAERERISTELSLATRIQADMLPNEFPAFPDRNEFDIYAIMDPAREVGGDFYDFYLTDPDHLCLVIADVSGKGIPAALFMMAARILIGDSASMGATPAAVLTHVNEAICASNREEMFVTVWLGILELSTGRLVAANAGHEDPALLHEGGQFELVKTRHDFVIGGMSGIRYHEYELQLRPGSKLFLYTDGVTEATSAQTELFGTKRLLEALNGAKGVTPEETLRDVRASVDRFVGDAEQFDDLTMMCLTYAGPAEDAAQPGGGSVPGETGNGTNA